MRTTELLLLLFLFFIITQYNRGSMRSNPRGHKSKTNTFCWGQSVNVQCNVLTSLSFQAEGQRKKQKGKKNNNNFVNNLLIVSLLKLISPGKNSNSFVVQWNTRFKLSKSPCLWAMPFSVQCQIWVVLWCASESPGFYDNRLLYAVNGHSIRCIFC